VRARRLVRVLLGAWFLAGVASASGQEAKIPPELTSFAIDAPDGRPVVFWHAARDEGVTRALAETARGFVPPPIDALDLPPDTFVVVVAPSEGAFGQLTSGRVPDWGLAVAFPRLSRIVIRSPRLTGRVPVDPATILQHELGHLYLAAATGEDTAVPRWFHEGFAALYANEWRWVAPVQLAWAQVSGGLVPLSGLTDSIAGSDPSIAYVQSMAAVRNLRKRGGDEGIAQLLAHVRGGATFDGAMRETYGLTLAQFYAAWSEDVGEYGWLIALTDERGLWVALALLVIALWIIRRRSIRREIDRRRAAEDAALGDPEDHALGVEEQDRYWEQDEETWRDERWQDEDDERTL
jgi:hypothetical protein